jgi:hypothetical protein
MDTKTSFLAKAKGWIVHGGSFRLRAYELACLEAWRKALSPKAVSLLDAQLERLSFYQRYGNEKLLCFYDPGDKACSRWPKEILFPCQIQEVAVARLHLSSTETDFKGEINAEVKLSRGRFFGLEFNKPPKALRAGAQVVNASVLLDPMTPTDGEFVTPAERKQMLEAINAILPEQYFDLAADGKGAVVNGWQINGLAQIRTIVQPDRNYYILAEKEGRGAIGIGIAEDDQSGQLYYLDYEDVQPLKIEIPLRAFVEQ